MAEDHIVLEQVMPSFKCFHDREEFDNLEDFHDHNKEFHKRFKKSCKVCHNVFRDHKKLKAHVKKYHDKSNYVCIHEGRSFNRANAFQLHNRDCHKRHHEICLHMDCLNVFSNDQILEIHSVQEHPKGRLRHKKSSKACK